MTTYTNDLAASAFSVDTSEHITYDVGKPGMTPKLRNQDGLTVIAIPRKSTISDWRLKSTLIIQVRRTKKEWLAETWLEGISEYGLGQNESDAITDLIVSLGEYYKSLKMRKRKLGDSALKDIATLEKLIEPL